MNVYVNLQLGYYPLLWMMHSRTMNTKINRIHERVEPLKNYLSVKTYTRNVTDFGY